MTMNWVDRPHWETCIIRRRLQSRKTSLGSQQSLYTAPHVVDYRIYNWKSRFSKWYDVNKAYPGNGIEHADYSNGHSKDIFTTIITTITDNVKDNLHNVTTTSRTTTITITSTAVTKSVMPTTTIAIKSVKEFITTTTMTMKAIQSSTTSSAHRIPRPWRLRRCQQRRYWRW